MDKKNKIIMINSFKGGAGKTSLALSYCIHNLRENEKIYDNIFYIDIDILGTGVVYTLFEDNRQINYFNKWDEEPTSLVDKVNIVLEENESSFYAVLLDPVNRQTASYYGENKLRSNQQVLEEIFKEYIYEFLKENMKKSCSNLFVFDCSPGLSNVELALLNVFNEMVANNKYQVKMEEIYVTTFDASHIYKTIDCLNEYLHILHRDNRRVTIILNDIYNCKMLGSQAQEHRISSENEFYFDINEVVEFLKKKLHLPFYTIRYNKFNEKILVSNMIKNERKLINDPDMYDCLTEWKYSR